ncbi:XdhC family protein [Phreatobacter cathodiphilus]|uniref:XdhC/CoxF family protein n=1 Tax=Phreatobacter cathodiphilus TaxID=1868589 RepID=A0A2S0NB59_9HYPH|nr:XdhC family protein [Phreatobacter cathodiphilus]AVO45390.1 XdhC/CoxF family protein [Phreatobacter cathodiphilus]
MRLDLLSALNAARAGRRAAVLVTDLDGGEARLVTAETLAGDPLEGAIRAALRTGRSGVVEGTRAFLTVQVPPAQMVIIGAVHISQALVPMARMLGYDPVIVDPRTAFATPERFPGVTLLAQWPDEALPGLHVDRYTAFIALTHDPKIDDPALTHAFEKDCFYIGALGSRKTHARRVERLTAAGVAPEALARIKAPVGLAIGAITPAEIAVSILAEVTQAWRQGIA